VTSAGNNFDNTTDGYDLADVRRRVKAILTGSIGNLIEWYDVYCYTAFSLYFQASFFPPADELTQALNAAIVFAATFVLRPFGSVLFGIMADKIGRRSALMLSVITMCFGALLIAICPTYADIGIWAAVILVVARALQSLSVGGEYGASTTYLAEVSHPNRRGFYSGVWYTTLIGGQLAAILVLFVLQKLLLTPEQLKAWGWRIPFVIGAFLAAYALYMRRTMPETDHFVQAKKQVAQSGESTFATLLRYKWELLKVIGITIGGTSAFYTYTIYMQKFLKLSVKLSDGETTSVVAAYLIFAIILQPIYGALSDKLGRKPLLVFFGVMGVLGTWPLLTALKSTHSALVAFFIISAAWLIVSGYTSVSAIVKAELFPTSIRALGVGLPYAITAAVVGGTVEPIGLALNKLTPETLTSLGGFTGDQLFYIYASALIFISLMVYLTLPDTKATTKMEQHS
jgi:MFS transporter, MHS family, alpha-ketoglutarate permease